MKQGAFDYLRRSRSRWYDLRLCVRRGPFPTTTRFLENRYYLRKQLRKKYQFKPFDREFRADAGRVKPK